MCGHIAEVAAVGTTRRTCVGESHLRTAPRKFLSKRDRIVGVGALRQWYSTSVNNFVHAGCLMTRKLLPLSLARWQMSCGNRTRWEISRSTRPHQESPASVTPRHHHSSTDAGNAANQVARRGKERLASDSMSSSLASCMRHTRSRAPTVGIVYAASSRHASAVPTSSLLGAPACACEVPTRRRLDLFGPTARAALACAFGVQHARTPC